MIEVSRSLGRVVFVRAAAPISELDVLRYQQEFSQVIRRIGSKALVVVDLREVGALPTSVTRMFTLMLQSRPLVVRQAFLYEPGDNFGAHMAALITAEQVPTARAFDSHDAAVAYLRPACTPPELMAVRSPEDVKRAA